MPSWEDELATLDAPSWEDELRTLDLPEVGVTLEGLDAEAAAAPNPADVYAAREGFKPFTGAFAPGSKGGFSGSNAAGRAEWGTGDDVLDTLSDFGARASNSMYAGYGDELVGLALGDEARDNVRNRMALAKERSPSWSLAGDIAGGAVPAVATGGLSAAATRALPFAGRIAAGAGLGAEQAALSASGYADDGDRGEAALDALVPGALFGAGGEAVASGLQGSAGWMRDTAAPWLREQGLLNRVASTGRNMGQLSKELGGRQGLIDAGQWMEDNAITQMTPQRVDRNLRDYTSMRQGDQRYFLDELAENPDAYPVDVSAVADDLRGRGFSNMQLAEQGAGTQADQYLAASDALDQLAPGGQMPFEDAWNQRKGFDRGGRWQRGVAGDEGLAEVNRDAANGLRVQMGEALDNTAPGLRDRWDAIQGDLSNAIPLTGGGDEATVRSFGGTVAPLNMRSMAAAAGGGPVGYASALAAQSGGRAALANTFGGASRLAGSLDGSTSGAAASFAGNVGVQQSGRAEGIEQNTRGHLLSDAAFQMMQQPGALGPYESKFWEAYKSPDSNALSALIVRLSNTDPQFKQTYLRQMQALTAEGY